MSPFMLRVLATVLLIVSACLPAFGTSYVEIADGRLADRAAVIVGATVLHRSVAPVVGGPATDYAVRVEEVLKGSVAGSVIIVRAPGGVTADGLELRVWGAPRLRRGERVVLFLEPTGEGVYRFAELALGVFLEVGLQGRRLLIRDLGELRRLSTEEILGQMPGTRRARVRDRERFTSWLSARAEGLEGPADYFVSLRGSRARKLSTLMERRSSWTRGPALSPPGGDRVVDWRVEEGAASRPPLMEALRAALESWELARPDRPPIRLAGTVASAGGLARYDGANTVTLGAPPSLAPSASLPDCPPDGIVSVSGTWSRSDVAPEGGSTGATVLGGDVVLLLGPECLLAMTKTVAPSFLGHGLSSALGLEAVGLGDPGPGLQESGASESPAEGAAALPVPLAPFAPTDLDNLEFYLISTDFGPNSIATCNTQACYDLPVAEDVDISDMYCDTVAGAIPGATGYAPEGCVRWWEDQSPFDCGSCGTNHHADEWVRGHEDGQDDLPKPAFISQCVNGQPCARIPALSELGPNFIQPACWELQWTDTITASGDFSIFLLVAPESQAGDWWYYGESNNGLRHNTSDDSLSFRTGGGTPVTITQPAAVDVSSGRWQLIEVHRNAANQFEAFVNHADVTAGLGPTSTQDFTYRYLGVQNCNPTNPGMVGKIAAFLLYSDRLSSVERDDVRVYLNSIYGYASSQNSGEAQPKGYQARACGFDMDDDLVYGEPDDDCNVCDGVTTDVDGDGQNEDLIYVDCDAGTDSAGCGSTANPCATLDYALNVVADGPSVGQEDIVCVRGTCTQENDTILRVSGKAGAKIRARSGSEERDFEYPRDPAMIVGWDQDDDGEYPPYDPDDTAVLYGGSPGCYSRPFRMAENQPVSFLELAHFTAREYGTCDPGEDGGLIRLRGESGSTNRHHYFHDLVMDDVNRARYGYGGRIIFNAFIGGSWIEWFAWENLDIRNAGGYNVRGNAPYGPGVPDSGPLRFQNISRTCLSGEPQGTGGGQCMGYKLWGYYSGIEVIDNVWDLQPEAFDVRENQPSSFAQPDQCVRDWVFRNNLIIDAKGAFAIGAYQSGVCDAPDAARTVDEVVLDRNIWVNEYDWGSTGADYSKFVTLGSCETVLSTLEDVRITNNIAYNKFGGSRLVNIDCALNDAGPNPGQFVFANNTFRVSDSISFGLVYQSCSDCSSPPCAFAENILFKNNIVDAPTGEIGMSFSCSPSGLVNDSNVYSPGAELWWGGSQRTWGQWQTATQGDGNAKSCAPAYVDSATGDLHLQVSDTCAVDSGETLDMLTTVDVDGQPRPAGLAWDIGSDEVGWYTLSVTKAGAGSGVVTSAPNGITCGSDCTERYGFGTVVAMVAVPDLGSELGGWSGGADCTDGTLDMQADIACTATFDGCSLPSDVQLDPPAQPIDTVELYEACNILRAGSGGFPIVSPGDVTFRAGNRIELQNGFSIGAGAAFKAEIGPP